MVSNSNSDSESDSESDFYTPGPPNLLPIRRAISKFSLNRAQIRTTSAYNYSKSFNPTENLTMRRSYYNDVSSSIALAGTQLLSNRFVSSLAYNPASEKLAASSWDGQSYILDLPSLTVRETLSPPTLQKISSSLYFDHNNTHITAGHDGIIHINNTPIDATNNDRINDLSLHPNHTHFFAASADYTWHFYDIPTQSLIYTQEGHTRPVTALATHPDGSILASASEDTVVKLWDLRSGQNITNFFEKGHINTVHALAWRNNGYHLASGGADGQLLIWDLRMRKLLSSIPAHSKLITSIKFSENGMLLVSTGYDGALACTATDSWSLVKKFTTLDKIMDLALIDNTTFITSGWDRSVKLYNIQ